MAAKAKAKLTTPRGELSWVFIDGEGSYNDLNKKFEYKATLTLNADSQDAIDMKAKYDALWSDSLQSKEYDSAFSSAKPAAQAKFEMHPGYRLVEDDDGILTGDIEFRFKTSTHFQSAKDKDAGRPGKPMIIQVYNAQAKKVSLGDIKIGNTSIGRISGSLQTWFETNAGGVSAYLSSIQLIELVEYKDNEFEDEQDGSFTDPEGTSNEFTGIVSLQTTDDTSTESDDNAQPEGL